MEDGRGPTTTPTLDDGHALDLEPPAVDPWRTLTVPRGWRGIATIARRVARDLDALTDHIVRCVETEIPAYAPGAVPSEDLRASVTRNVEMILVGLAEHRGPTPEEIAIRRELGVRRALQGLPVAAVIQAFHVGYRELWLALVRALPAEDPATATRLLTAATTVWGWVHQISDAIAAAHSSTVRRLEARVIGARQRFVELLAAGDLDGSEAARLARSLTFDPGGPFVVTAFGASGDDHDAVELQRRAERLPGQHAVVSRGALVVVVSQADDDTPGDGSMLDAMLAAGRDVLPEASVAVGAERTGLRGARASLVDAELTLEVTPAASSATFEEMWLWATLAGMEDRLRSLLAPGVEVTSRHPHLAEAVQAFAESRFSVSEAARTLAVHANTVAYRLDRWYELTGWDPRTFDGLVRSLAALRLDG